MFFKKLMLISIFVLIASFAVAEEQYDPQYTLQALNVAIASIHKILSSNDKDNRVILTQEYENIINNLNIGNISSDYEIIQLFIQLMKTISNKTINLEEKQKLKERYDKKKKRQIIESLSGLKAYGGNGISWIGSLFTSCISSYFSYKNAKEDLKDSLDSDLWQLKKEELEDCNEMRQELLSSSWILLREYRIPDEYRLTEKILNNYYKAINNPDAEARLRIIKRQEQYFQAYPPYWIERAIAAESLSDLEDTKRCYDKFEKIWRPIWRKDPYRAALIKYRIKTELSKNPNIDKTIIEKYLDELKKYSEDDDWANNILIGFIYFQIGNKEKAIDSILANIDSGYENEISNKVLEKMKADKMEPFYVLSHEEKNYYNQHLKTNIDKLSKKENQTRKFYLEFKKKCEDYLDYFKVGIYRNACEKYIEWINKFEKEGILLKEITMIVHFPNAFGGRSNWIVYTPFGEEKFNGDKDKPFTWEKINYKFNDTSKGFRVNLYDSAGLHSNKDWGPINPDKCYLFNFPLVLPYKKMGDIKLEFNIKMDAQEELLYQQVIDAFNEKTTFDEISNLKKN